MRWPSGIVAVILLAGCADADLAAPAPGSDVGGLPDSDDAKASADARGAADRGALPDVAGELDAGALDASTRADASPGADAAETPDATETPDAEPPDLPPDPLEPCDVGRCWTALSFGGICGRSTLAEDFSSRRYNVHAFALFVPGGVAVELTLRATNGAWSPALLLHDADGETLYDGERGVVSPSLRVEAIDTGRDGEPASLRIEAREDRQLTVFLTAWHVIDGGFEPDMPPDVRYTFTVDTDCEPPEGEALLSPPNFDEEDVAAGYFLLPISEPDGLYTRKAEGCSRGTRLLIDVLYTVAVRWNALRPELSPIAIRDLNEGPCSDVDHATHDDGTHADLVAGCATDVDCEDTRPAIDLATLFIETGQVCGIIFNDADVQAAINPLFEASYDYEPWFGTFMRTVGNHVRHFHVRVKKPDGTCN